MLARPLALVLVTVFMSVAAVRAQPPPPGGPGGPGPGRGFGQPLRDPGPPPMERGGPTGRWWTDPALIQMLGLTADQQKRIDALFQQSRVKLIDLSASLQKEEAILEPLLEAEHPEEPRVLQQIDRIAQARAELEKANARMLLGFRGVLTQEQWKKLQASGPRPRHP